MFIEPEGRGEAGGQGDVSAALRRALALEGPPLPKAHLLGTHRAAGVAEMLARVAPHLAPCGIARVSRITGFDRTGLEVFTVARPNARGLSVANGKGLDRATARLSGVMEALERWHAEHVLLPLRFGTAEDVAALGAPVVVAGLPRARTGDPGLTFWASALDVAAGTPARVPFELVHCAWVAAGPAPGVFEATTDGLASGSHPVEAALHGLCELIETDACALFEGLPPEARAARRLDPATIDDPGLRELCGRLAAQGFALALWDATSDIGAPVLLAVLVDERDPRTPAGFGAGCHPDRAVATFRAISEAAQTRVIAMTGTRDDLGPVLFAGATGLRFRWALEAGGAGRRDWRAIPSFASDCLRADLAALVARVAAVGAGPVLAVDLGRLPGLSVIRVLVPGLEPEAGLPGRRAARPEAHLP